MTEGPSGKLEIDGVWTVGASFHSSQGSRWTLDAGAHFSFLSDDLQLAGDQYPLWLPLGWMNQRRATHGRSNPPPISWSINML